MDRLITISESLWHASSVPPSESCLGRGGPRDGGVSSNSSFSDSPSPGGFEPRVRKSERVRAMRAFLWPGLVTWSTKIITTQVKNAPVTPHCASRCSCDPRCSLLNSSYVTYTNAHVSNNNTNSWGFERLYQASGVKCNANLLTISFFLTSRPFRGFEDLISEILGSFWTPADFPLPLNSFSNLQHSQSLSFHSIRLYTFWMPACNLWRVQHLLWEGSLVFVNVDIWGRWFP